jgi:hypothetical protein
VKILAITSLYSFIGCCICRIKEGGYSGSNSSDESDSGQSKSHGVKLPMQRRSYYENTEMYRKTLRLSSDQIVSI